MGKTPFDPRKWLKSDDRYRANRMLPMTVQHLLKNGKGLPNASLVEVLEIAERSDIDAAPPLTAIVECAAPETEPQALSMIEALFRSKDGPRYRAGDGEYPEPPTGRNVNAFPLVTAVRRNCLSIVRFLLDNGFSPNVAGGDGKTPLSIAAALGDIETVKLLLERDADPTLDPLPAFRRDAFCAACRSDRTEELLAALTEHVAKNKTNAVDELLTKALSDCIDRDRWKKAELLLTRFPSRINPTVPVPDRRRNRYYEITEPIKARHTAKLAAQQAQNGLPPPKEGEPPPKPIIPFVPPPDRSALQRATEKLKEYERDPKAREKTAAGTDEVRKTLLALEDAAAQFVPSAGRKDIVRIRGELEELVKMRIKRFGPRTGPDNLEGIAAGRLAARITGESHPENKERMLKEQVLPPKHEWTAMASAADRMAESDAELRTLAGSLTRAHIPELRMRASLADVPDPVERGIDKKESLRRVMETIRWVIKKTAEAMRDADVPKGPEVRGSGPKAPQAPSRGKMPQDDPKEFVFAMEPSI